MAHPSSAFLEIISAPTSRLHTVVTALSQVLTDAGIEQASAGFEARELLAFSLAGKRFELSEQLLSRLRLWEVMNEPWGQVLAHARELFVQAQGERSSVEIHGQLSAEAYEQLVRKSFADVVSRRANREPLQWILGYAPFRNLELQVGPGVFVPRPETELVVQAVLDEAARRLVGSTQAHMAQLAESSKSDEPYPLTIVDLCAGSGAIGLSIAQELPQALVVGVELSDGAFAYLRRNEKRYALPNFCGIQADVLADNLGKLLNETFAKLASKEQLTPGVDIVISNPPYLPTVRPIEQPEASSDPDMALYGGSADGMKFPQALIHHVASILKPGGFVAMEHDLTQGQAMREAYKNAGFEQIMTAQDYSGADRWSQAYQPQARAAGRRSESNE
ncbi:MAG: peptide chain release factor N(5)-glutamine methyltransferase [Aeriscardovia aeriphila]|nr:peptide chain release factor N(5)-glutamine methyltransferase [Aeriscardovia aeriphila]